MIPTNSTGPASGYPSSNEDLQRQINELRERLDRVLYQWPIPHLPVSPQMPYAQPGCHVCGIPGNVSMGYVCNHPNCPSRITC